MNDISSTVEHACRWRWAGPAPASFSRPDCDSPVLLWCSAEGCGRVRTKTCEHCRKCDLRYKIRVRGVARLPLLVAKPDSTLLLTLTAPGAQRHCSTHTYLDGTGAVRPSVRCFAGLMPWENPADPACVECECSTHLLPHEESIAEWNATVSRRWNDFLTDLRRSVHGFRDVQFFRALELQERGALHIHVVLRLRGAAVIDDDTRRQVTSIAMHHLFGHEVDIKKIGSGKLDQVQAARYVAKYVTKSKRMRIPLPLRKSCSCMPWDESQTPESPHDYDSLDMPVWREKSCEHPRQPMRRRFRLWTCSRRWGMSLATMIVVQTCWSMGYAKQAEAISQAALDLVSEHQT